MSCECAGLYDAIATCRGLQGVEAVAKANFAFGIRAHHYEPIYLALKYAVAYCLGDENWSTGAL